MRRLIALIPEQLEALTEAAGWSQMELAFRCGVTQATASRWLSGVSPLSGVNSEFIRAEMALDAGRPSWPPPSFDELMKLLKGRK